MSALTRYLNRRKNRDFQNGEKPSGLYRLVTNISIISVFVAVGLIVISVAGIIKMNTFLFGLIATIAIVSIACLLLLPWVRVYEKGEHKMIAIVFLVLIALCALLWLIAVYMGIGIYVKIRDNISADETGLATLKFVKVTLIISLQLLVASLIAGTIIRYKSKMLVFQIITYLSNLFFDIYVTCFLLCLSIVPEKGLQISKNIKLLGNKIALTLFILSILYMIISSKVMQVIESRRFRNAVEDNYEIDGSEKVQESAKTQESAEQKLESLKNMLDKNLISQEEYDKKKAEILNDM